MAKKTITESLIQLRNDLKTWVSNNLATKADINHAHTTYDIKGSANEALEAAKEYVDNSLNDKVSRPDWNENDETSPSYIKNRPFYTKDPAEVYIVEESSTDMIYDEYYDYNDAELYFKSGLIEGQYYTVSIDGVEYPNLLAIRDYVYNDVYYIGSKLIYNDDNDTVEFEGDYPFSIYFYKIYNVGAISSVSITGTHTISIKSMVSEVVKMDEKYLPDSINDLFKTTYDTITWDGNTENMEMITVPYQDGVINCVKVSDNVLTYDDFSDGLSFKDNYHQEYYIPQSDIFETNGFIGDSLLNFMVVPTDNFEHPGIGIIPKKGFYLSRYDNNYISSLTIYGYNGFSGVKKLKTIPVHSGGTGCDSIADTICTISRYRASSLHSSETTPTINGVIAWTYE